MADATLIASYVVHDTGANTGALVTPSFTPSNDEVIVVKGTTWDTGTNYGAGPTGGGQTFSKRVEAAPGGFNAYAVVWTATVAGSPGSMTVSMTPSAASRHSMVVERWTGRLAATPAVNSPLSGSGTPAATVTTTGAGSVVSWCSSDVFSRNPATRAYLSSATEEDCYDRSTNSDGVWYYAYQAAATAGAQTVGMSAPGSQGWVLAAVEILAPASGGTTFTKSVSGAATPSGGLSRRPAKTLTGATTPTGLLTRQDRRYVGGAIGPAGQLVKLTARVLSGGATPSSVLLTVRARVLALAGALAPSGAVARQLAKTVAGAVSPSGAILRQPGKSLAGSVSPSGALATIRTRLLAVAGAVAPSGLLLRRTGKPMSGGVAPVGVAAKQTVRRLAGSITPTGAVAAVRSILLALAGAVTPSGALMRRPGKTVGGAVAPTAGLARRAGKGLAGATAPSGLALKVLARLLGGDIAPAGASTHVQQGFVATMRGSMRSVLRRSPAMTGAVRVGPTMRKG
ncbi:hypothetical protein [Pseudonocardia sp. 73-21]|uniref:hypothetical protein n=1 Tax=Pseudonocardia sp. 73-21 TaxID=1895809 RepID=UPI00096856A0|nr:hypothetical protein [Pseudonocardia sp. 73-21]OJY47602.1 MAG: hypothetical protein BGP03_33255 [Pseudonocardia sp. 73-21]